MTMRSEDEWRRLAEIEAALRLSDPGLDRALRTFRPRRRMLAASLIAGWSTAALATWAGWWIITLIIVGPLLAITVVALAGRQRLAPAIVPGDAGQPRRRIGNDEIA